jgi:methylmalonyl-CoA mutase N-terminal domain/subunit
VERLATRKAARDGARVGAALGRLENEAREDVNLMPAIVEAAQVGVTLGEMCDALRRVWGVWRETPVI